jgi:putative addiction module killer protein
MDPEDESSEPSTDAELFDSALDVGGPNDGAIDNPNADTSGQSVRVACSVWRGTGERSSRLRSDRLTGSAPMRPRSDVPAGRCPCVGDTCQLQFTGVEGGQERHLRPLAPKTEGSACRRSGARPHRPLGGGNPVDVEPVGEGVSELRINCGPDYRVYFLQAGDELILLLCGGDKSTQDDDIKNAKRIKEWMEARNDERDP